MKRLLIITTALLCFCAIEAQNTTRRHLKPIAKATLAKNVEYDTIAAEGDERIVFSGYEKVLRATKESFFVTNNSSDSISKLTVTIEYKDMKDGMLDSREESVELELPPSQTRKVDIPTWDRQQVLYYFRSPKPKAAQATPYKVSIRLKAALMDKKQANKK